MPGTDSRSRVIHFGPYEMDQAAHELRKNGLRIHLQDQPWEVLCALLEQPGEMVSREDLRQRLWPDGTFVDYEHNLNKVVNKLREALCDSAENPRYVETVARHGYRFSAPVQLDGPKDRTGPERKPARAPARLWWGVGALGLLTAGILVTGIWPVQAPRTRVTQLTHGSRLQSPFLAVHGGRILYTAEGLPPNRAGTEFWSITTNGGEPRQERFNFLNPDYVATASQVNSRQGDILIRSRAESANRGELWLAGFDGSKPRRIGDAVRSSYYFYSVSPDLKTLLRPSKEGLFARSVEGGPERLVAQIEWQEPWLFWHPSGERIGFYIFKEGSFKVWDMKVDGTGMRPLLAEFPGEQKAANWSPDGKRLYFVSEGELYMLGSRGWLGWMRKPEPQRLTAGSVDFAFPIEDPADPHTVYAWGAVLNGESMKLNRKTDHFEPYLGGLSADCLDYSPDGQWIAYVSYPGRELWKCRRDGSGKILLESGLLTFHPRWSPDGNRLAFAGARRGVWGEPHRIYTIDPNGGKAEPVKGVNGPGFDPNWSPDGKKLVFAPYDFSLVPNQDRHLSIVDWETGELQTLPGSEDMFSPRWSPDRKHLVALRWEQNQPVIYDLESRRWAEVQARNFGFPAWSKDGKYVYGIMGSQPRLARIALATHKVEAMRTINEFRLTGNLDIAGVSWTPDGEPVVLEDLSTREIYRIDVAP